MLLNDEHNILFSCGPDGNFPSNIYLRRVDTVVDLVKLWFVGPLRILYLKGLFFPLYKVLGGCGNFAIDMYWGTELYPQFLGIDLKQFVICRMGMVLWYFFAVSFFFAAERDFASKLANRITMETSTASLPLYGTMSIYVFKFFCWEKWYFYAADIQVDRFGFMLCWGTLALCLAFILCKIYLWYTIMSNNVIACMIVGNTMTYLNYDSDTTEA